MKKQKEMKKETEETEKEKEGKRGRREDRKKEIINWKSFVSPLCFQDHGHGYAKKQRRK